MVKPESLHDKAERHLQELGRQLYKNRVSANTSETKSNTISPPARKFKRVKRTIKDNKMRYKNLRSKVNLHRLSVDLSNLEKALEIKYSHHESKGNYKLFIKAEGSYGA